MKGEGRRISLPRGWVNKGKKKGRGEPGVHLRGDDVLGDGTAGQRMRLLRAAQTDAAYLTFRKLPAPLLAFATAGRASS